MQIYIFKVFSLLFFLIYYILLYENGFTFHLFVISCTVFSRSFKVHFQGTFSGPKRGDLSAREAHKRRVPKSRVKFNCDFQTHKRRKKTFLSKSFEPTKIWSISWTTWFVLWFMLQLEMFIATHVPDFFLNVLQYVLQVWLKVLRSKIIETWLEL